MGRMIQLIKRYPNWGWKYFFIDFYEYTFKYQYKKYIPGELAMKKLVDEFEFNTVLDIGCGDGAASKFFTDHGKVVTACDYGRSVHFEDTMASDVLIGDFNTMTFENTYDCIWCSHVLEHQLNVQQFLEKVHSLLNRGGVLAISVPPYKPETVGGHVSLWTQGVLLYRLILAGFDCSDAYVKRYGYNISVIVKKSAINVLNDLSYDRGDLAILRKYFPRNIKYRETDRDISFDGSKIERW